MINKLNWTWFVLILLIMAMIACGGQAEPTEAPRSTLEPLAAAGETVFKKECAACHSVVSDTTIVGPSLLGIASRAATRVDGQDAETYLLNSIMDPGDYIVENFDNVMPSNFGKKLTGEEIDSLVVYLLTLQE